MNVYDFDGTIYNGDSSVDFIMYCLKKYPATRKNIVLIGISYILYKLKMIDAKTFKENFFSVLRTLNNQETVVQDFWNENISKIAKWYIDLRKDTDVIISASPEFLLSPLKSRLDVQKIIGTEMNLFTGKIIGENCKGIEKVNRFRTYFPDSCIGLFYSDSKSDIYMALLAKNAYFVKDGTVNEWKI